MNFKETLEASRFFAQACFLRFPPRPVDIKKIRERGMRVFFFDLEGAAHGGKRGAGAFPVSVLKER
jgi:hypothetical protein